ncbi:M48 family metallopeptidase [Leptothrix sp. BB-4]
MPQLELPLFELDELLPTHAAAGTSAVTPPPVPVTPASPPMSLRVADTPQGESALWRHPRGNREIRLGGQTVSYELKRARRRTIGFVIGAEGLVVSAPRWVGQPEIDAALQSKTRWVLRKLADQHERIERIAAARVSWRDGTSLPYLGEPLLIVLDARVAGAELRDGRSQQACADGIAAPSPQAGLDGMAQRTLHIGLPQSADATQIRDAVQSWLQRQAIALFETRCRHYAAQLGVRVTRLRLSSAQTRWGSASADGTVRLNWRLIHFSLASIDYVVAHELAHLREMNHSAAFWDVVRSVMPDYESRRGQLKDGQVPVFD